jgi:hypothetical protein
MFSLWYDNKTYFVSCVSLFGSFLDGVNDHMLTVRSLFLAFENMSQIIVFRTILFNVGLQSWVYNDTRFAHTPQDLASSMLLLLIARN